MLKKINKENITITLLMGVVLYFIFFLKLDAFQIRPWDEAIYANTAFEMWKSGKMFAPLRDGLPDLYNSKPLLPIWLQVISISAFGFNELAVRLPSAIAGVCAAIGLFFFVRGQFNSIWAWSSFFVLVTSVGFIHFHASRTGDMDTLLAVFLAFAFFHFFRLINEEQIRGRDILLFMIFTALAFSSKSFAALLFLPAQVVLLGVYRKLIPLFKKPQFYIGLAAAFIIAILPILIRNAQQPGYLNYLVNHDALRLGNVIEGHQETFEFYFNNLFFSRFSFWIIFTFIGLLLMIRSTEQHIRKMGIAVGACVFSFLLIISLSITKLDWYDVPLYPLMAIPAGYAAYSLLLLLNIANAGFFTQLALLVFAFSIPLCYAIKKSMKNEIIFGERKSEELTTYLYLADRQHINLDKWCVVQDWHFSCLDFYRNKMSEQKRNLKLFLTPDSLRIGDHALIASDSIKSAVRKMFRVNEEKRYNDVSAFEVVALK